MVNFMTEHKLKLNNISKSFGEVSIITNIQLEVRKGEILGLIGPSGCGKTTLLQIICGLVHPTSGELTLDNVHQTWGKYPFSNMTYLFQRPVLYPHLDVLGNVALGVGGTHSKKEKRTIAMKSLEFTNIRHLAEREVFSLSGGEAQRVAFARGHAQTNELMLLDEPFASVDVDQKFALCQDFRHWIKELKKSAIFVTHDHDEAKHVCDRIVTWEELQSFGG
jgi:putative spermidine/putrescine transport system ATP-binding protein